MKKLLLHAICVLVTMTSCKKGNDGDDSINKAEKGYATGKVADTKGKPLSNVEITVENVLPGASNSYTGKTDANGFYKIKIGPVGEYHASAYHTVLYNGVTYSLPMHSDNDAVFSNEGAVRNFEWKLTGSMYSGGRYGSSITLDADINFMINDPENIEYTLKPVGKLIDGSDGQELVLHPGLPNTESYGKLLDIPIGRYTLSAVYLNRGARKPLRLKLTNDYDAPYRGTVTIDFPEFFYEGVAVMYNE
ncbi:carboxypeptidase-like regulatory domain-containing protein [Pseudobacter ginsenosidimutans]|uniref:Carboxypeptidase family protein n=1 Tax=Pseudobacter ginsenosidimutans TaxID=661488 RepID=A0A4Q7MLL2_9BACT|nr:carboxypeptidase-like regulatory domain-containing protein [Pseudobacter ginsenosidimutans]RZS69206.1 carboxypeptidase family protein [Pseudobacter ginsenosidimutans]